MTKRIPHITEEGIEKKRCCKCQTYHSLDTYNYSKQSWDNLRPECKVCIAQKRDQNKEKKSEYNKKHWQKNKEELLDKNKKWREANKDYVKEKMKEWLEKNKEHKKQKDKEYRIANWEKKKEYNREWRKKDYQKMKTDPNRFEEYINYKIKSNTGRRIREVLKQEKSLKTIEYVGCSLDKLRIHFETKFSDGMNWSNYGESMSKAQKHVWHIDHKMPCDAFDLMNPIHQKACFHYKNLQPLWWDENIRKLNTFDIDKFNIYLQKYIEIYVIP